MTKTVQLVILVAISALSYHVGQLSASSDTGHYLNEWVAEIRGGPEAARTLAKRYGYELVEEVRTGGSPPFVTFSLIDRSCVCPAVKGNLLLHVFV
jgi:hypothetical protein